MTKDEALRLALEFIEQINKYGWKYEFEAQMYEAITAIKEALAQPESDYERGFIDGMQKQMQSSVDKAFNAMAQRTWVGLTDDELSKFDVDPIEAKLMIAKLKEKNT